MTTFPSPTASPTLAPPPCTYASFDAIGIVNLVLLFFLICTLGMTVRWDEFKTHFRRPVGILVVLFGQFVFMPALGYGLARSGVAAPYGIGIFAILTCPGGAVSNLVCLVFQADLTMSVALTTSSSLVAIFMMPLNLYLYLTKTNLAESVCIDPAGIACSAIAVVLGVFFGIFLRRHSKPIVLDLMLLVGVLSGGVILFIGLASNASSKTPVWTAPGLVFLITAAPPIIGTVFGLGCASLARFPKPQRVPIALEIGVQNKLVALSVISLILSGPARDQANAVPIIYAIFASCFAFMWGFLAWQAGWTNLDRRAGLWTAIKQVRTDIHAEMRSENQVSNEDKGLAGSIVAPYAPSQGTSLVPSALSNANV